MVKNHKIFIKQWASPPNRGLSNDFLGRTPEVQVTESKVNKWSWTNQTKRCAHSQRKDQQNDKDNLHDGKKVLQTMYQRRALIAIIY